MSENQVHNYILSKQVTGRRDIYGPEIRRDKAPTWQESISSHSAPGEACRLIDTLRFHSFPAAPFIDSLSSMWYIRKK
jgi:hypothetical protein